MFLWWRVSNICQPSTQDNKTTSFTKWRQNTYNLHSCHLHRCKAGSSWFLNQIKAAPALLPLTAFPGDLSAALFGSPVGLEVNPLGNPLGSQGHGHISQITKPLCRLLAWKSFCQTSLVLLWWSSRGWKHTVWRWDCLVSSLLRLC